MNETERIELIKKRLAGNEYFINPHADVSAKEDIEFLIERVALLAKKAQVLGQQVAELTTEIENVKSDFGNMR